MCTLEKEKSNKKNVILAVIIVLLLGVIGVLVYIVLHPAKPEVVVVREETEQEVSEPQGLAVDSAAVAIDDESLKKALEQLAASEGSMALEMKATAYSTDGKTFACSLANSARNKYNMYMVLYLDEAGEEIYRSGLIPVGKKIESFTIDRQLSKGTHECTIVYTQVEDDNATVHATVNVGIDLTVQ
jgi:hypothetical protein